MLTSDMIVKAWENEEIKNSLTPAQRAQLPANPAGETDTQPQQEERNAPPTFTETIYCTWQGGCLL
jgi:mersacidin/lichenicidin family type 2 lantibiotic